MTPAGGPDFSQAPTLKVVLDIGDAAFKLALPVLAGFIAYGMAGRPGLVPGLIGGYLAGTTNAGFLGALLVGLIAGHVVNLLKKLPVHKVLRPIMPIIVIPIISSLVVGVVMLKVLGVPIAGFMTFLGGWLQTMSQGNAVVLAAILGAMIAFDMGGPVNKAAFFFGAAMIKEGQYAVMGACAAAICTPPLGLALATLVGRRLWTDEQRESGLAALGMGMVGITEGAIPFAAGDPVRVIPSIMLGSMVAATIAMLGGVGDHAPHGGPIVLPVVDHRLDVRRRHRGRHRRDRAGDQPPEGRDRTGRRPRPKEPRDEDRGRHGLPHRRRPHLHGRRAAREGGEGARPQIKVETQGAMGIENELSQADVDAADVAILAADIALERPERFDRIRRVEVPGAAAHQEPEADPRAYLRSLAHPMAGHHAFTCPLPNGIHARPASALEDVARRFALRCHPDQRAERAARQRQERPRHRRARRAARRPLHASP